MWSANITSELASSHASASPYLPHLRGTRSGHRVLEHLKRDVIVDGEVVKGVVRQVTSMKEHLAIVCRANEPVALTAGEARNPARGRVASHFWPVTLP